MHFRFITSTPQDIVRGSGTFAGISTLATFLRLSGATVDLVTPTFQFPLYTVERLVFNETLRFRHGSFNVITIGFDMDGFTLAGTGRGLHIASIKGVIADEMRFEAGLTKATMRLQARCEKRHVQRADVVLATSHYSSRRIQELYGIANEPRVVPELIDLTSWRRLLQLNPAQPEVNRFIVLCVCRFYPRKRLNILLGAIDRLRSKIPGLEIRIVGDGPEARRLKSISRNRNLHGIVTWLGNLSQDELAREYNRCHVFCLPSIQEGFGIVFLEAMASAKPIVAARASSTPEVVKHGILAEPDDEEALAEGIRHAYADPGLRAALAAEASHWVKQFDAPLVAATFLREVELATKHVGTAALGCPSSEAR
ncbi:MAG TPA: glycosyltransferase family 4 protein [Candidatus Eremiobacteraceae bacterium]|nr:glycosyltransferase family 4 protein [Candidatus Eremiobacteraceae bacterium]